MIKALANNNKIPSGNLNWHNVKTTTVTVSTFNIFSGEIDNSDGEVQTSGSFGGITKSSVHSPFEDCSGSLVRTVNYRLTTKPLCNCI